MKVLAYLDAGSGSIMLQAILGGIAAIALMLKVFGRNVLKFVTFGRKGKSKEATD